MIEKIIITGGAGFIGSHLVDALLQKGNTIIVHAELQQKDIESSLPLMNITRQWSDRKKKVEVPLFRSYVFVRIDISKEKFDALQTDGVVKFVTFCNKTVSIPEEQMYWLD
jgi:nucleoside-diphosphate-sugar epimerase